MIARTPSRAAIVLAFVAVYLVWGSTYLAMRIGVQTLPPFMLGAARFFLAGVAVWTWHAARGQTRLLGAQRKALWKNAAIAGLLLLVGGNGGVVWAVQHIPSGLAALIVGAVPLWIVAIEWIRDGRRPPPRLMGGVLAGLVGMAVLLGPDVKASWAAHEAADRAHALGVVVVLGASFSWSLGSLWSRRMRLPGAPLLPTGMQMLCGGAALLVLSAVTGEWRGFDPTRVSGQAVLAVAYLVVFGSLVAYSAYIWLLQMVPPARVATYAFVNPVVAVFLGWAFAGESLSMRTVVAAAIILGAVAMITLGGRPAPTPARRQI